MRAIEELTSVRGRDLAVWLLNSRRRLTRVGMAVGGVVVVLLAVSVAFGLGRATSHLRSTPGQLTPTVLTQPTAGQQPGPSSTGLPQPAVSPTRQPATSPAAAAVAFMAAWGNYTPGEALETWRVGLRPYVTDTLFEAMALADISNMHAYRVVQPPSGDCTTGGARSCRNYQTGSSAQYTILLDSGDQVMVTVTTDDGQHWLADNLTPAEGN